MASRSKESSSARKTKRHADKKRGSGKDDGSVFKIALKWVKEPKSKVDRPKAKIAFQVSTASGKFKYEKTYDEAWKFIEKVNKQFKDSGLANFSKNAKKTQNDYLKSGKNSEFIKYLKDMLGAISRKKTIATDPKIHKWMGAEGKCLDDLQSGQTFVQRLKSIEKGDTSHKPKSSKKDESKEDASNAPNTPNTPDTPYKQLEQKYREAQEKYRDAEIAIEKLKADRDAIRQDNVQREAELKNKLAESESEYQDLMSKYKLKEVTAQKYDRLKEDIINVLQQDINKNLKFINQLEEIPQTEREYTLTKKTYDESQREIQSLQSAVDKNDYNEIAIEQKYEDLKELTATRKMEVSVTNTITNTVNIASIANKAIENQQIQQPININLVLNDESKEHSYFIPKSSKNQFLKDFFMLVQTHNNINDDNPISTNEPIRLQYEIDVSVETQPEKERKEETNEESKENQLSIVEWDNLDKKIKIINFAII